MDVWPYPFWFAHRGAGRLAPENTLAAFRHGAALGWRAFECDVKLSADGVPFLLHDDTLERTTNGQGPAGRLPWRDLATLDAGHWHDERFAGEPLARLDVIAAFVLAASHALNIEIKPSAGHEAETGRVVAREVARLWAGRTPAPLLSSFEPAALQAAHDAVPQLPRALLVEHPDDGSTAQALALGCVAIVAHHRRITPERHGDWQRAGLRALAYTVNDPAEVTRLFALGIDGLITDAVDRFTPDALPPS